MLGGLENGIKELHQSWLGPGPATEAADMAVGDEPGPGAQGGSMHAGKRGESRSAPPPTRTLS